MAISSSKVTHIEIIQYPGVMRSATEGLRELFELANSLKHEPNTKVLFEVVVHQSHELSEENEIKETKGSRVIILPPCLSDEYYSREQEQLSLWLQKQHAQGALLCSVCAGAFILAQTGLLDQRSATTHWMLSDSFAKRFPKIHLDDNKILINDGDLITAGGLMAWLDLGLELVAQFASPTLMRQLGKRLVVDTGPREQRYYRCFMPRLDHGDRVILKCQHDLQRNYSKHLTMKALAKDHHLTERTLLRRFVNATGLKPKEYLQQLRISKACEALENTQDTVEIIAQSIGYEDVSAFRKIFIKTTGLTPREFRSRFGREV